MVDNFIPNSRKSRSDYMINYRFDNSVIYKRRTVSLFDVVQPRATSRQTTIESANDVLTEVVTIESETVPAKSSKPTTIPISTPRESHRQRKTKKWLGEWLYYGIAGLVAMFILALTGYVSIDTWLTNSEIKQVVTDRQEAQTNSVVLGEGEDEAEVSENAIDSYRVAGDLPRVLTISSINVRARVLPMSVNADGAMQAPVNIFDSGWYGSSAKPGQPGATVIDAHASGPTREGLFAYLDTLKTGDRLSLETGDGTVFTYEVSHTEIVDLDKVDMDKLLRPYGGVSEGVNLITCTGKWIADQDTYDQRVIVYTKRVEV